MVLRSLSEALGLVRREPILWMIGLVMGCFAILNVLLPVYGGTFYAEPLALFQVVALPLLAGGVYGTIRTGTFTPGAFFRSGMDYYFRILLPAISIFFAALVTILLLAVPLAALGIVGAGGDTIPLIVLGVLVPFAFLTFFYDTVAVFEDRKVFDSIRRSIEFVINDAFGIIGFYLVNIAILAALYLVNIAILAALYLVNIAILAALGFAGIFVWTILLSGRLQPLIRMNTTEIQMLTPQNLLNLLGVEGILVTAVIYAALVAVFTTVLYAYKACFFRNRAEGTLSPQGEYDEKGRWYRY